MFKELNSPSVVVITVVLAVDVVSVFGIKKITMSGTAIDATNKVARANPPKDNQRQFQFHPAASFRFLKK